MVDAVNRYQYSFMDFDPLAYSNHMREVLLPEIERDFGVGSMYTTPSYRPTSSANDGKFSFTTAMGNFFKGLASPVTNMFSSVGNFFKGAAMIAAGAAVVALGGAPILIALGVAYGGFKALQFGYKLATAQNGDEAEQAFYNLGEATFALGGSYLGARAALNSARNAGAAVASADDVANMTRMQALRYSLQADTLKASGAAVRTNASARFAAFQGSPIYQNASQRVHNATNNGRATGQGASGSGRGPEMGKAFLFDKNGNPIMYYDPVSKQWHNFTAAGQTAGNTAGQSTSQLQIQGNQPRLVNGPTDNAIALGQGNPQPLLPSGNSPAGLLAPHNPVQTASVVRHFRHKWDVAMAPADKGSTGVMARVTDPVYNVSRNYVHNQGLLYPLKSNGNYNTAAPILQVMDDGSFAPYIQVA